MSEQSAPVRLVFYQSPWRWARAVVFAGIVVMLVYQIILDVPELPLSVILLGLLLLLVVWAISRDVWSMETRLEGVCVRYTFGNSRLIPYDAIKRLAVQGHRWGPALHLYTENRRHAVAMALGLLYSQGRPDPADDLIFTISQAAHLTRFSKSWLGWLRYSRERPSVRKEP